MHKILLSLSLVWGLLLGLPAQAEDAPVAEIVLLTENFPPYNMASNGRNFAREDQLQGIAVELVQEMFQRAGVNYHMTLRFPWARIYKMAMDNPNHGVFTIARLRERGPLFKWVGPLGTDDWVLLANADSNIRLDNLQQAGAYRIGAYKDDAISQYLQAEGIPFSTSLRDQENLSKLQKGQIDLWATGDLSGRYLAKQEGVSGLKTVLRFNGTDLYLALNPQTPDEVVNKLQQALQEMQAEGALARIVAKYL